MRLVSLTPFQYMQTLCRSHGQHVKNNKLYVLFFAHISTHAHTHTHVHV